MCNEEYDILIDVEKNTLCIRDHFPHFILRSGLRLRVNNHCKIEVQIRNPK